MEMYTVTLDINEASHMADAVLSALGININSFSPPTSPVIKVY